MRDSMGKGRILAEMREESVFATNRQCSSIRLRLDRLSPVQLDSGILLESVLDAGHLGLSTKRVQGKL